MREAARAESAKGGLAAVLVLVHSVLSHYLLRLVVQLDGRDGSGFPGGAVSVPVRQVSCCGGTCHASLRQLRLEVSERVRVHAGGRWRHALQQSVAVQPGDDEHAAW